MNNQHRQIQNSLDLCDFQCSVVTSCWVVTNYIYLNIYSEGLFFVYSEHNTLIGQSNRISYKIGGKAYLAGVEDTITKYKSQNILRNTVYII